MNVLINIGIYRRHGRKYEHKNLVRVRFPHRFKNITPRMVMNYTAKHHKGWLVAGWARSNERR